MVIAKRMQQIQESATLKSAQKARDLEKQGVDVIHLTLGEPDFDTPKHIKQAAIVAIQEGKSDHYLATTGILPLKEAIVSFHKKRDNVDYTVQQVIVGTGAKHILYALSQVLIDEEDKVILPTPYWVSYSEQVKLAGGEPIFVETTAKTHYKLTQEHLDKVDTTGVKAIILNSPNNPTGSVYTTDELNVIGNWAVKHDIWIISDEIYNQLVYDGAFATSIASLSEAIKRKTILINGVAKAFAMTGWRIGYALCENEEIIKGMTQLISHETSNATAVSQYAALAAYSGTMEPLETMRAAFEDRLNAFYHAISQIDGFSLDKPQGAFYLFVDIKKALELTGIQTAQQFCDRLLQEAYVAVVSGEAFGAPNCIRMSYAGDKARLLEAAKRIENFMKENRLA